MGNLNGKLSGFHGVALPSTVSRSNWNLEMLVFVEGRKLEYPEKNLSEQEPTTNSTHIRRRVRESNPGHIGGSPVLALTTVPSLLPCYIGVFIDVLFL